MADSGDDSRQTHEQGEVEAEWNRLLDEAEAEAEARVRSARVEAARLVTEAEDEARAIRRVAQGELIGDLVRQTRELERVAAQLPELADGGLDPSVLEALEKAVGRLTASSERADVTLNAVESRLLTALETWATSRRARLTVELVEERAEAERSTERALAAARREAERTVSAARAAAEEDLALHREAVATARAEVESAVAERAALEQELVELRNQVAAARAEMDAAAAELERAQAAAADVTAEARARRAAAEQELAEFRAELLAELDEEIDRHARARRDALEDELRRARMQLDAELEAAQRDVEAAKAAWRNEALAERERFVEQAQSQFEQLAAVIRDELVGEVRSSGAALAAELARLQNAAETVASVLLELPVTRPPEPLTGAEEEPPGPPDGADALSVDGPPEAARHHPEGDDEAEPGVQLRRVGLERNEEPVLDDASDVVVVRRPRDDRPA